MKRFWDKVKKTDTCWIWTAGKDWDGYGAFKLKNPRKQVRAHRLSWEIKNGPIPKGLYVLHKCDNPSCVNPDHLFLGTNEDNLKDMAKKGRSTIGERNPSAKLSKMAVWALRAAYHMGGISISEAARNAGISFSQARRIIRKESWKDQ